MLDLKRVLKKIPDRGFQMGIFAFFTKIGEVIMAISE
jgi:hypothetical protein